MRGPVNQKDLAIESTYGYLNIHLSLLFKAQQEEDKKEIKFQTSQIEKCRNALEKLGYFERAGIK